MYFECISPPWMLHGLRWPFQITDSAGPVGNTCILIVFYMYSSMRWRTSKYTRIFKVFRLYFHGILVVIRYAPRARAWRPKIHVGRKEGTRIPSVFQRIPTYSKRIRTPSNVFDNWEGLSEDGTEDKVVDWLGQRALYKV